MKSTGFQVPNPTPPWWPATWPTSSGASNRWSQTCECNSPAPHQRETEVAGFFLGGSPNHFQYEGMVYQQNPGPGFGKKAGRFGENPPLNCLTIFCVFWLGDDGKFWMKMVKQTPVKKKEILKVWILSDNKDANVPPWFVHQEITTTPPNNKKIDVEKTTWPTIDVFSKCFVSSIPIDPRRWDHRSDPRPLSQKGKWDPSRRSPVTSRSFGTPTRYVLFFCFWAVWGFRQPKKTGWGETVTTLEVYGLCICLVVWCALFWFC